MTDETGFTLDVDLLNPATFADGPPHKLFDLLRNERPIYGQPSPMGGTAWSLTRFADIRAVGTDLERFTSAEGMHYPNLREHAKHKCDNIMFNDPPTHTRLRMFAAKAFSAPVVARFDGWIRELCVEIVDKVLQQDRLDIIPAIASELPGQVIAKVMGVPDHERPLIIKWANDIFGRLDPLVGIERSINAVKECEAYAFELRERKLKEPGTDMATELAHASRGGMGITDDEYKEMISSLIIAGYETTHTLIAQSLVLMARDPLVRQQVETTPAGQMGPVVEELLRYTCPVMHMGRTAKVDLELNGQHISKGDFVLMWFTAANRDPAVFKDPHSFNAGRPRVGHASFGGGGPHLCMGAHLARLEGQILLEEMNRRSLRLELDGEPERSVGVFINALRKVPMRVVK
ncbi:cytochrome P450 [Pseudomonas sp. PDM24]|uniref:cytochrome P450 n=1 Tax=Pseudomonas sp. PDM24 TaxID=2854777 RepID=UPI001C43E1EE|nr:cytochrome P450 [Pseudomonas sp. PDM24]MBV7495044.1 cytochrome P450 [Pseudomonas sp. PDM24]